MSILNPEVKKILLILHYPPPVHGASMVGKYISESKKINSIFQTKYVYLGTTKSLKEQKSITLRKIGYFFKLIYKSLTTAYTFRPNLIYLTLSSNGMGFYKDAFLVFLLRGLNIDLIYHLHNKGVRRNQNKTFDNWLYKKVFKKGDVILLSKKLYGDIQKYVQEERVFYCANGIPEIRFKEKQQSNAVVEILFLSNLIVSKGVFCLIEACKLLSEKGIDFHCYLIGNEGDVSKKEVDDEIRNSGLISKVEYIGTKYGDEKREYFENADVFVFPTYYPNECFPLVLLEAMQYKIPVITTNEGAIEEIIEHNKNGYIVEKKNPKALAEKMEYLIKNEETRILLGDAGYRKYSANYTVEAFEKRLVSILSRP